MRQLVIIGAGGHGKVIADIAQKQGYTDIMFLDDDESVHACGKYPVVGKVEQFRQYGGDVIVAIGNAVLRQKIQTQLMEAGRNIPVLIHTNAVVAKDVEIGIGTVIMAGAVVNTGTHIGKGCIINTCASVDHDNIIEDYVHVSVGSHVAGSVHVGERTWIGIGTSIVNNIEICNDCLIGAGAVVVKNIECPGTYVGVPARRLRK